MSDALRLRSHILSCFEQAATESDPGRRRQLLTFLVVGAGATGVELMTSIHALIYRVLTRDYPYLDFSEVRLVMAEAQNEILPGISRKVADVAMRYLRKNGIELLLGSPVSRVWSGGAETKDGHVIPAETIIWTAGIRAHPVVEKLQVEKDRIGRIVVDDYLELPEYPGVYAVGDNACIPQRDGDAPVPPMAPAAIQAGRAAAQNIVRNIHGEENAPFRYKRRGDLLYLGATAAAAEIGGVQFDSLPAWLLWHAFYLSQLTGVKNKLGVALDWTFTYLYRRQETARLELVRD